MNNELKIPRHIAIIMDGNGRWAKEQGKERFEGHIAGVKSLRNTIEAALDYKISYLTAYAFSTENWGRPKEEVDALMELFVKSVKSQTPDLLAKGVSVKIIGDMDALSSEVRSALNFIEEETASCEKLTLVMAVNYSSRDEIKRATQALANNIKLGEIEGSAEISEKSIEYSLDTAFIPDPDLIIRTGGEYRLSNFLLWQAAYSELYFTDVHWPEFGAEHLRIAIEEYSRRDRRFGKLNEES